jgi:hypothetical protein
MSGEKEPLTGGREKNPPATKFFQYQPVDTESI